MGAITQVWRRLKDRQFQWMWFSGIYTASILCSFSMALGCTSSPTARLYVYRVNVTEVAMAISYRNQKSIEDYLHPDLPSLWLWGFSGVCFQNEGEGVSSCKYSFPPLFSTQDLLNKVLDQDTDPAAKNVVGNWNEAYANTTLAQSLGLVGNRSAFVSNSRGAAAMLILSLIVSFVNLGMTVVDATQQFKFFRRWTLLLTCLDFIFLFVCFSLTTNVRNNNDMYIGANSISTIFEYWGPLGPAFPVLATGIFLKIGALPIVGPVLFIIIVIALIVALYFINRCCMSGGSDDERDG